MACFSIDKATFRRGFFPYPAKQVRFEARATLEEDDGHINIVFGIKVKKKLVFGSTKFY